MAETYTVNGVAHEIIEAKRRVPGGPFTWIDVRCGAVLPPQLGPANIGDENTPVTCLECLGGPTRIVRPLEDYTTDEDGSIYYDDD